LNGGILIWHIDEAVIDRQLSVRGVNAYPERRGVDLEEADGAQDIGEPVQNLGTNFSNGTAFDFWWAGNNSSVITSDGDTLALYENRFGTDTHPNNKSNSGSPTFFEFYDFSGQQPVASFRARHSSSNSITEVELPEETLPENGAYITSLDNYLTSYPLGLSVYTAQSDTFLIIPTGQTVYALQTNSSAGPLFDFQIDTPQQPYLGEQVVVANKPDGEMIDLSTWNWDGTSWQNSWNATGDSNLGLISSNDDNILYLDLTTNRFNLLDGSRLADLPAARQESVPIGGQSSVLTPTVLTFTESQVTVPVESVNSRAYTGALQLTETEQLFFLIEDESFYLIDPEAADPKQLLFESASLNWPALADFDNDGRLDFLYVDQGENELRAINSNGALLNSFPIPAPEGTRFTGTPLITDLEGDESFELIIPAQDSLSLNLYAYDASGRVKPGFPLYAGSISSGDNQPVHPVIHGRTLYAVSHSGDLKAWRFEHNRDIRWGSIYGNEPYNKVTGRISDSGVTPVSPSVLVKSETYNWPNPAKEETYIRFQTSGPGKVEVKIITMSGRVIFDQDFDARGGPPEEYRISTASWGSGIYLAKVKAKINGREASKLIKIAVVH
ncbi:MAG: T9SS type A sorting domain-containing protein, partial [Bacteroidales bacterium]|nr:T9SS type A sorting domain-containing protein [Bacteroidales bacterium]